MEITSGYQNGNYVKISKWKLRQDVKIEITSENYI